MAELKWEDAQNLARSLKNIGHPYDQACIDATAFKLQGWCKGAFVGGVAVTPLQQGHALIGAALEWPEGWPEKGGIAALKALFVSMFPPKPKPQIVANPECLKCGGVGFQIIERDGLSGATRCNCWGVYEQPHHAQQQASSDGSAPNALDTMQARAAANYDNEQRRKFEQLEMLGIQ